jgi:hypothetical protein
MRKSASGTLQTANLLNYTPEEMQQLDRSTTKWLNQLGLLKALGVHEATTIADIEAQLRNGTLLCVLVEKLFVAKLVGVFKEPKTESTCLQNIRKALDVLRKIRRMDQSFTWSEKQI